MTSDMFLSCFQPYINQKSSEQAFDEDCSYHGGTPVPDHLTDMYRSLSSETCCNKSCTWCDSCKCTVLNCVSLDQGNEDVPWNIRFEEIKLRKGTHKLLICISIQFCGSNASKPKHPPSKGWHHSRKTLELHIISPLSSAIERISSHNIVMLSSRVTKPVIIQAP